MHEECNFVLPSDTARPAEETNDHLWNGNVVL